MSQLKSLQLTEIHSKKLLTDIGSISDRSSSTLQSAKQLRRESILSTQRFYRAIQKDVEQQQNIRENKLNCMFIRRKESIKNITKANQDIFIRIHTQKSQYTLKKLKNDYKKSHQLSNMISKHRSQTPKTARPLTSISRAPLAPLVSHINLQELDRHLRSRDSEIRLALQE